MNFRISLNLLTECALHNQRLIQASKGDLLFWNETKYNPCNLKYVMNGTIQNSFLKQSVVPQRFLCEVQVSKKRK